MKLTDCLANFFVTYTITNQIETRISFSDYTPSTEPVSAMIMTKKITDEPGSGTKACKKGIK